MKKILSKTTFTLLLISIIVLGSCKKDNEPVNSFKFNGQESVIGTTIGSTTNILTDNLSSVALLENTLKVIYVNEQPDSIVGKGNAVVMIFYSKNASSLITGTYTYYDFTHTDIASDIPDLCFSGLLVSGVDTDNNISGEQKAFKGGTVKVKKEGENNYELVLEVLLDDGKTTLSGYYKGAILFYQKPIAPSQNNPLNKVSKMPLGMF